MYGVHWTYEQGPVSEPKEPALTAPAMEVEQYLTTAEIARVYRVSTDTVRAHATEMGGERIGRQWRFPSPITGLTFAPGVRGPNPIQGRIR